MFELSQLRCFVTAAGELHFSRAAQGDLARQSTVQHLATDADGKVALPLTKSGLYLALVRYQAPAPAGAAAPMYGNNYTLTFRVLDQ